MKTFQINKSGVFQSTIAKPDDKLSNFNKLNTENNFIVTWFSNSLMWWPF